MDSTSGVSLAVMVSGQGRGSNMAALISACAEGTIPGKVGVVIGTRADMPALLRAQETGVPTAVVSPRKYEADPAGYGETLLKILRKHEINLICLAGYMRRLPEPMTEIFRHCVMNVHAALLPSFGGQGMYGENVHRAVLESGVKITGCTVHFVDEEYDSGPIIVQRAVAVAEDDTPQTLAARVLTEEHQAYVEAVRLFAQGRLRVEGHRVRVLPEQFE
jgi:phosphoribosylglycinamide formyltransferase 1